MKNKNTDLNIWAQLQQSKKGNTAEEKLLEQIWEHSDYATDFEPNVELGLKKLKTRIQQDAAPTTAKRVRMHVWLRAAAAVFVIATVAGLLYNYQANSNTAIAWVEVHTTDNEQKELVLPDGSTITLNENSSLAYDSQLNTAATRQVRLEGEAFFDINRRPEQAFVINSARSEVEVLGTSFNLRDYAQEAQTELEVSTGRVAFRTADTEKEQIFTAQQTAIIKDQNIKQLATQQLNRSAWKTQQLNFKQTALSTALPLIARSYDISFIYHSDFPNCSISGNWENESLDNVLALIESLTGLTIKQVKQGTYSIQGSC